MTDAEDIADLLDQDLILWDQVASIMTARQAAREMGVELVSGRRQMLEDLEKRRVAALEMLRAGDSGTDVAQRLSLDLGLVLKWAMEGGVAASIGGDEHSETPRTDGPIGDDSGQTPAAAGETRELYLGRIPLTAAEGDIRDFVERITNVVVSRIHMPLEWGTGSPRGFAFITVPAEDAEYVMARLDGHLLGDSNVACRPAARQTHERPVLPTPLGAILQATVSPARSAEFGLPLTAIEAYEICLAFARARGESGGRLPAVDELIDTALPFFDVIVRAAIESQITPAT